MTKIKNESRTLEILILKIVSNFGFRASNLTQRRRFHGSFQ